MDKLLNITHQALWVNMRKAYYEANPLRIEQMLEVHNDIVEAILKRDTETAIHALEADFDNVLKQLYYQYD
jgi:DNA-binding GntR family transcriptional regulator